MSTAAKIPILNLVVLPVEVEVEGCIATILEVAKLPLPWEEYQASVQVRCGNATSRVFQISYKNSEELKRKLVYEVTKFRYIIFLYGAEELRKRGIVV